MALQPPSRQGLGRERGEGKVGEDRHLAGALPFLWPLVVPITCSSPVARCLVTVAFPKQLRVSLGARGMPAPPGFLSAQLLARPRLSLSSSVRLS